MLKICAICGSEFKDNSQSHTKRTCSNRCRDMLLYQDINKYKKRLLQMRFNVLKAHGVSFDKETRERIITDLEKGQCFICKKRPEATNLLHIDHDHITGEYRGVLCSTCNQALGLIGDSPAIASEMLVYLIDSGARGIDWYDVDNLYAEYDRLDCGELVVGGRSNAK